MINIYKFRGGWGQYFIIASIHPHRGHRLVVALAAAPATTSAHAIFFQFHLLFFKDASPLIGERRYLKVSRKDNLGFKVLNNIR